MKHFLLPCLLLFLGVGCLSPESTALAPQQETHEPTKEVSEVAPEIAEPARQPQVYVQFIQNVHDWIFAEKSIETLNRLIDLHEHYKIPVEFYLTDTMTQIYVEQAPDLIERIKTSPYVAVSYHVRPPHPIVNGFNKNLLALDSKDRYETLMQYETHRLDMETGEYTDEPGGYAYLTKVMGYAPRVVGHTSGPSGKEYSRVLKELGAKFTVLHEGGSLLEETVNGLHKRPEDQEVKLYEFAGLDYDMDNLFREWTKNWDKSRDWFVNLKFHENNFYLTGTPFGPIYWKDFPESRNQPYDPPYDIEATSPAVKLRDEADAELRWTLYEDALKYVAANRDRLTPINSVGLEQLLEKIE